MADCCDNCREGKVCCSILDKQKHDHDHDHEPASVRGSNPRTRRSRGRVLKATMPVIDSGAPAAALAAEQLAASARVATSAGMARVRHNPAPVSPSGLAVSDEQKRWLVRGAGVAAIVAGVALGVAGWKRWKR